MRARAISREALVEELAERIAGLPRESYARVAVDGSAARPARTAGGRAGRAAHGARQGRVAGCPPPISCGPRPSGSSTAVRTPDVFYDDWLDTGR